MTQDILSGLNPAQRAAVENYDTVSLIIAGAGSGKTRVLTSRIAYMIQNGVEPQSILALTFTNKAAAEMRERIAAIVGYKSRYITMGTFHSIFLRILRAEAASMGYNSNFTVYDATDAANLVKTIIREKSLPEETYKHKGIYSRISHCKNDLITPQMYESDPAFTGLDRFHNTPQFAEIYAEYVRRCKANMAMDFDDLLLNMNILLSTHPELLEKYQGIFKYILVDEYQDTNHAQYKIIKALAQGGSKLCVVGDDAQSIYSFRGAKIENIMSFKRDFPDSQIFKLEQNYRSTQTIVNAANSVIGNNSTGKELNKKCFSQGPVGEPIRLLKAYTDREEAELIARDIQSRKNSSDGMKWSDIAILYRVNARSRVLEESLRRREIPYRIYHGRSFFDRKEVKDFIAYMRLIVNPHDDEAFKRIINTPARGIGGVTVDKIARAAEQSGLSMWQVLDTPAVKEDKTLARKTEAFRSLISGLSKDRGEYELYQYGRMVATQSGLIAAYKAENTPEAMSAIENIEEVLNSMEIFRQQKLREAVEDGIDSPQETTVDEWLQNVALLSDVDTDDEQNADKVTLMTVHSAKGLEFRCVYIVGMEDEQFPGSRDDDPSAIEEERRLFYVALTRAKELCTMSFCEQRYVMGSPQFCRMSRFVKEIDRQYISAVTTRPAASAGSQNTPPAPRYGLNRYGERTVYGKSSEKPAVLSQIRQPARQEPRRALPTSDMRLRKIPTEQGRPEHSDTPVSSEYAAGMRVFHAKFGNGTITAVEQGTSDLKLTVKFDASAAGIKTLLSKFAKLTVLK